MTRAATKAASILSELTGGWIMDKSPPDMNIQAPLKIIGVGGAGINTVNAMIAARLLDVDYLAISSRESDLVRCHAEKKFVLHLPPSDEVDPGVYGYVQGAELLLMVAGMGGTTGTALAPVIAQQARDAGVLVMAIVSRPFASEGKRRAEYADTAIETLRKACDCLVVIPNDSLERIQGESNSLLDTFKAADDVVAEAILALTEQGRERGDCFVEISRIREILTKAGPAGIVTGIAGGENRAAEAVRKALACPLIDGYTLAGAAGLIISVTGASNIAVKEYEEIIHCITAVTVPDTPIISGMEIKEALEDQIRVTIIATGLKDTPRF